jgi:hypothetical protein
MIVLALVDSTLPAPLVRNPQLTQQQQQQHS